MEKSNIAKNGLTIKLSDFEGPIDLLLHLIKKSEMNIFDLKIADITSQYLDFIHAQQAMRLDVASEYLVMAATLVKIKSANLLPEEEPGDYAVDEEYADPREELMLQLLTYKQFQVASESLREREQLKQQSFPRTQMKAPDNLEHPITLAPGLSLGDLQTAFAQLLRRKKKEKPIRRHVTAETYSLEEAVNNINKHFLQHQTGDMIPFASFFDDIYEREHLVVTFLALLEMAKDKRLKLHQEHQQQEIYVEIEAFGEDE
ncbi:segregation and condensation protein A [Leuconostoc mesenteroides]|uniref:segregation and condensation protein A n=1 Tax=Leuconostoc mesenteroides TaxID=1245 RepID=UPI001CC1081B|nr:segregation/condensation protein A [Leuconostoc mesenteroides]MBZ1512885.1 segregation/condensation protein A [Leuconostoc mesenteroides]